MSAIPVTGQILDGPIAKNLPKDMPLHCAKFHTSIIKGTIPPNSSHICSTKGHTYWVISLDQHHTLHVNRCCHFTRPATCV